MKRVEFTIKTAPRTKKNSQVLKYNSKEKKVVAIPSKAYRDYERKAEPYMTDILKLQLMALKPPFNVKALFYMDTRRRVDLVNLEQALCDLLVHYRMIPDDNSGIIKAMDGSRVLYDKDDPRTEVTIEEMR